MELLVVDSHLPRDVISRPNFCFIFAFQILECLLHTDCASAFRMRKSFPELFMWVVQGIFKVFIIYLVMLTIDLVSSQGIVCWCNSTRFHSDHCLFTLLVQTIRFTTWIDLFTAKYSSDIFWDLNIFRR